ncbi:MAG: ABC transporter permease subunit [Haloarculaceae archaeon]
MSGESDADRAAGSGTRSRLAGLSPERRVALDRFLAVVEREYTTVLRTRSLLALAGGFGAVVVGLAWVAGTTGYVPAVLNLLTPVEVLVPALAVAFGYGAVLGDRTRGELDVVRTYPLDRREYLLAVYLGRSVVLLFAVLVPLFLVAVLVALTGGAKTSVLASHAGADSFVLFVRFVVLSGLLALVSLAVAVAVSAAAGGPRSAAALGIGAVFALVVGIDLAIVAGIGTAFPSDALPIVLAFSPTGAYRGLVLASVLDVSLAEAPSSGTPLLSLAGLLAWLLGPLALAVLAVAPVGSRR